MENDVVSRSQKSASVKQRIFRTGRDLFREYGYENVSVKMITEAAGVSTGSFYHFYGSKSALLEAVSLTVNDMFSLPENLDYAAADCKQTILSFYKDFSARMSSYRLGNLMEMFFPKGGNKTLMLQTRAYRRLMKTMLSGFQDAGKISADCSVDELEEIIMIGFYGTVHHWVLFEMQYPLYKKLCAVIGSILDGYLVSSNG